MTSQEAKQHPHLQSELHFLCESREHGISINANISHYATVPPLKIYKGVKLCAKGVENT